MLSHVIQFSYFLISFSELSQSLQENLFDVKRVSQESRSEDYGDISP